MPREEKLELVKLKVLRFLSQPEQKDGAEGEFAVRKGINGFVQAIDERVVIRRMVEDGLIQKRPHKRTHIYSITEQGWAYFERYKLELDRLENVYSTRNRKKVMIVTSEQDWPSSRDLSVTLCGKPLFASSHLSQSPLNDSTVSRIINEISRQRYDAVIIHRPHMQQEAANCVAKAVKARGTPVFIVDICKTGDPSFDPFRKIGVECFGNDRTQKELFHVLGTAVNKNKSENDVGH